MEGLNGELRRIYNTLKSKLPTRQSKNLEAVLSSEKVVSGNEYKTLPDDEIGSAKNPYGSSGGMAYDILLNASAKSASKDAIVYIEWQGTRFTVNPHLDLDTGESISELARPGAIAEMEKALKKLKQETHFE